MCDLSMDQVTPLSGYPRVKVRPKLTENIYRCAGQGQIRPVKIQ